MTRGRRPCGCTTALWLLFCGAPAVRYLNAACLPLSEQTENSLAGYVRKVLSVPPGAPLSLTTSSLNERTCYWRLQFVSADPSSRVTLFLSPDERFLSTRVFDTSVDPDEERHEGERRTSLEIKAYLESRRPPVAGPPDAPITIAVFGDFQCPYCARELKILMQEVRPKYEDKLRITFVEFPLPNHPWARTAAEAMTCLAEQSLDLFWKLHDFIYDHQTSIRPDNLQTKIEDQVKQ
jgi:hypothetical protein